MADNTADFFSAKAFREACDRTGLTKKAIAAALAITPTTLSSLYSGRSTPSLKLLTKMVEVFGGELSDFLEMPSRQRWELKHFRIASGLTQAALAQCLGVAPSAVSGWELGKYPPPANLLPKLAELYGVSLEEIQSATHTATSAALAPMDATLQLAETVLGFATSAVEMTKNGAVAEPARHDLFTEIRSRVEQALTLLAPLIPQLPEESRSHAVSLVRRLSEVHDTVSSN